MLPPALTGTFIRRQGCPHHESEIIAQPDLSLPHSSQNTSQNAFLHTFQARYFLFPVAILQGSELYAGSHLSPRHRVTAPVFTWEQLL